MLGRWCRSLQEDNRRPSTPQRSRTGGRARVHVNVPPQEKRLADLFPRFSNYFCHQEPICGAGSTDFVYCVVYVYRSLTNRFALLGRVVGHHIRVHLIARESTVG